MKKIVLLLTLTFSIAISAQEKITEGVITTLQTMSSENEQINKQFQALGGLESITYFKGFKTRAESSNPMSGDVITITDAEAQKALVLMDNPVLGKKYLFNETKLTEEQLKGINVVEGKETKTILGLECKQFFVALEKDGVKMKIELFTSDVIPVSSTETSMIGDKIKGFPLYMTLEMNQMGSQMTITTTVTNIKKETVSDDKFSMTPPEGYEQIQG